jgi:hypothetical protein
MDRSENKLIKLALYGDSLACPRIGVVDSHQTYIALIEQYIRKTTHPEYLELRNKAEGGATLHQLYQAYAKDNTYYTVPGDFLIIHAGVVDCAPRPVAETTKQKIGKLPAFIKRRVIRYLHNNRANIITKSGGHVITSQEIFRKQVHIFLTDAEKNYKKVFVINICPTNQEIEAHSPGFSNNIKQYNTIWKEEIDALKSSKIKLINIHDYILSTGAIDTYILKEDGHHIYPITHQWIAETISKQLI